MQSIEYRYSHDPMVKALVDSLEHHINKLQFTPSEIRECAMLAAIHYEQRQPQQSIMEQNGHIAQQANTAICLDDDSVICTARKVIAVCNSSSECVHKQQ